MTLVLATLIFLLLGGGNFCCRGALAEPQGPWLEVSRAGPENPEANSPGVSKASEGQVVLAPFYLLRKKGQAVWVERILLTLAAEDHEIPIPKLGDNPFLRDQIFHLLQMDESDELIKQKVRAELRKQTGKDLRFDVGLSRDILIVR